jgi:hypothetical protein
MEPSSLAKARGTRLYEAMRTLLVFALISLSQPVWSADDSKVPPVLRTSESTDSVVVTLPGAPANVHTLPAQPPEPVAPPVDQPPAPEPSAPKTAIELNKRSLLPPDLQREVAIFCQKLIGQWTEEDAEQIFGKPLRTRSSFSENKAVNGKIYAFVDPTGRYRELELDFDQGSGTLRTVFAYPKQMTWKDCQKRWNGEVAEADARQGRMFYSYLNRRLDVLVDARGRVISLGLY